jgi:hypothetical protein
MNRVRVRPVLRRIAIALFVILLPIATHDLWDYLEVRRLVREVEGIREKGDPVSERDTDGDRRISDEPGNAGSYYLAASMLTLRTNAHALTAPVLERLADSSEERLSLEKSIEPLRQLVEKSSDALALADKAANLSFTGFPGGTAYTYRTVGLGSLIEVIMARSLSLSASGRGNEAVDSVITGLEIRRALREAGLFLAGDKEIAGILSLSQPSLEALRRLQMALEKQDRREQYVDNFVRQRARYLDMIWPRYYGHDAHAPRHYSLPMHSILETLARPWISHQAVGVLQLWAELIEVARIPPPQQAQAVAEVFQKYREKPRPIGSLALYASGGDLPLVLFAQAVRPDALVIDRSCRVAVALEMFRRDHGAMLPHALSEVVPRYLVAIPIDPFSGGPLLYRAERDTYTIYSVGANLRDDGGDVTSAPRGVIEKRSGNSLVRGADVGIRVRLHY